MFPSLRDLWNLLVFSFQHVILMYMYHSEIHDRYWTNMKDCHFFPVSPWVQVSLGGDCGTIYPIALWNDSELFVSSSAYSEFLNYWICHLRKGAKYRGRDDNWSKWLNMSCSNHFSIIIYLNAILYQPT